ncbi:MAG TPA: TraR/DksA C4-type zinc finger protein [Candidatus Sulfotelmatobacter sp.]|nr:TraR/DksA C4-type zinc finger protein [Candidatus Sulfotelmatobacter sp.]HWI56130.1 TraR/DksA C4-type zinc finger protein [Bacillota bacterium]
MQKRKQPHTRRKPKATTEDVVGAARTEPQRFPAKWRKYYDDLMKLRDHLLNRQVDLAKDAIEEAPTFSLHMADAGTDTYDRDFALGMLSSEQDALYQIEQALDRIRNGTYGICELTGKPIEPERLAAIPWTRFSTQAEKQLEREGATKRAGLGPRDTVINKGEGSQENEEKEEAA